MSSPQAYTEATLLRMLRAYAALEADGRTMSAIALAEQIGIAGSTGPGLRRACIERGWLDVIEPPRGSLPGRLRVMPAGRAVLDVGMAPPPARPSQLPYSRVKALRALRLVADAEEAGSTISGYDIGLRQGFSEQHGMDMRTDLIKRGWVKTAGWLGNTSILRLTPLGRDALTDAPPSSGNETPTLKPRKCLCCGTQFPSSGPGNRICAPCRATEAYQSSPSAAYDVRLRR